MAKRILYVSNTGKIIGGGEFSLLNLVTNLDKKRFEPLVVVPGEGDFTEKLNNSNLPYLLVGLPTLRSFRIDLIILSIFRLIKIIKKHNIDLIHANGSRAMLFGGLAALAARVPCVWHLRVADRLEPIYDKFLCGLAKRVIAISSAVVGRLSGAGGVNNKIRLIHNGVDLKLFHPDNKQYRKDICAELGIDSSCPIFTTLSQLTPWKRIDTFIQAAALVTQSLPEAKFVICGNEVLGSHGYLYELEALVKEKGLEEKVVFVSFREDPERIIGASDIFVLCSENEAFGRVIIESMASEVVVVATKSGGVPDIIEHEKSGYLFELDNYTELAERLVDLHKNPREMEKIYKAGRERVVNDFSIEMHVKRVQELYDELFS